MRFLFSLLTYPTVYLALAFVHWDIDAGNWSFAARAFAVFSATLSAAILCAATLGLSGVVWERTTHD